MNIETVTFLAEALPRSRRNTTIAPTEGKTAARSAVETMLSDHNDVVRESVAFMVRELIEAEVSQLVGAELGERSAERSTRRNGDRHRRWDTREGTLDVAIPKLRQGSYFPSISSLGSVTSRRS